MTGMGQRVRLVVTRQRNREVEKKGKSGGNKGVGNAPKFLVGPRLCILDLTALLSKGLSTSGMMTF